MDYLVNGTALAARRGRPPRFCDSDVIQAVRELGLQGISLAKIARHIGVSTPALYRAFSGLEDVIELCISDAFELYSVGAPEGGLKETVEWICKLVWDVYNHYPGLSTMVMQYPFSPKLYLGQVSAIATHLSDLGLTESDIELIFRHVPLILASHHSVFEHQDRDRKRLGVEHVDLTDMWLSSGLPEDSDHLKGQGVEDARTYAKFLVMDWNSAWNCVQDIMRLTSIDW